MSGGHHDQVVDDDLPDTLDQAVALRLTADAHAGDGCRGDDEGTNMKSP
jgi:hypothetical protein